MLDAARCRHVLHISCCATPFFDPYPQRPVVPNCLKTHCVMYVHPPLASRPVALKPRTPVESLSKKCRFFVKYFCNSNAALHFLPMRIWHHGQPSTRSASPGYMTPTDHTSIAAQLQGTDLALRFGDANAGIKSGRTDKIDLKKSFLFSPTINLQVDHSLP